MIRALLFDWGNTIMQDFGLPGPMYEWEKVAWVDGAEGSLRELSEIYPCYLATNAGRSDAGAVLKALKRVGADNYLKGIFASSDIGFEKPDQRFFEEIMKHLKINAGDCAMIGDNYLKDITGAKNCGMVTVFFNPHFKPGIYPMADQVIRFMGDLPAAIMNL